MRKLCLIRNIVSIVTISFLVHNFSVAHSEKTNSEGCHHDTKNKTYYCHNKKIKSKKKITGKLKVIDGDTIHIGSLKYRFKRVCKKIKK
jgi:hypothetical protein